jgi:peptidoglycan hydrolase CwlO-like protein
MNEFYYKEEIKLLETENLNLQEKIKVLTGMIDKLLGGIKKQEDHVDILKDTTKQLRAELIIREARIEELEKELENTKICGRFSI